jgi:signal transduction histidine kinase
MIEQSSTQAFPWGEDIVAIRKGLEEINQLCAEYELPAGVDLPRYLSDLEEHLSSLERQLEAQAFKQDELEALYDVSQAIGSSLELEEVLHEVMDQIIRLTEAERVLLMLIEPDSGELELRASRNVDQETIDSSSFKISRSIVGQVAESGEPVLTTNAQEDPRFKGRASVVGYHLRSILCVPLKVRGNVTGVIYIDNRIRVGLFSERDRDLLTAFASQGAIAIENARLFDDLRSRVVENEQLNEELTRVNRELARLDQAKSDFINIASHELRTPLTQVIGYNDMLHESIGAGDLGVDEWTLKMTNGVRQAALRLKEIVDTMLDVSQLDAKALDLVKRPTSIVAVVKLVAEEWESALERRQQTLTLDRLRHLPIINADDMRLRQVFSHLLQNAIKYTPDGGQIRITGRLCEDGYAVEGEAIEVVVTDDGIGIVPDDLERIFDKFYRIGDPKLHSTGRTKFKGAGPGLGLAIARGIVEAHGGCIWAESSGRDEETCPGSAFHVVLPVGEIESGSERL